MSDVTRGTEARVQGTLQRGGARPGDPALKHAIANALPKGGREAGGVDRANPDGTDSDVRVRGRRDLRRGDESDRRDYGRRAIAG